VPKRRVFFALWPDKDTSQALVHAARSAIADAGGRATPAGNLHVTLAFLGPVTDADIERVRKVPPLASPALELRFDTLGYWRRARLLWVAPSVVPPALIELESVLWEGLAAVGFERDPRAYRPHITLARKARGVEQDFPAVSWTVSAFALVESRPGARSSIYEVLEVWPFESGT